MIIFLYGKDNFRSRQQLQRMKEKFVADRDPEGMNVISINCAQEKESSISNQLFSPPFLAEKRMVILESLIDSKHEELRKLLKEKIEAQDLPAWLVLVVFESAASFKKKEQKEFFARLQKEKYAQEFDLLDEKKLPAWISATIEERGGTITRDAIPLLFQGTKGDMWQLHHCIDQLIAYCAGKEITQKDIALFVDPQVDDNVFTLVDMILAKKPDQVFAMIMAQYEGGKDPQYVFAMILRQIRILLEIKDIEVHEGNIQSTMVAKQLGVHPFVVKKSLHMLKGYSVDELQYLFRKLLVIDRQVKTGVASQDILVDLFVGEVCSTSN